MTASTAGASKTRRRRATERWSRQVFETARSNWCRVLEQFTTVSPSADSTLRSVLRGHVPIFASLALTPMAIILLDRTLVGNDRLLVHAGADELGHAFTALAWIVTARSVGLNVMPTAALMGAVAIDVDHVPLLLGVFESPPGTTRPFSHSLLTVALLVGIAVLDQGRRRVWVSAAYGVGSHLFRDLARGHLLLFWPVSARPIALAYQTYYAVTVALILVFALARLWPLARPAVVHSRRGDLLRPIGGSEGPGRSRTKVPCFPGGARDRGVSNQAETLLRSSRTARRGWWRCVPTRLDS
jgi:inner membrane protein